MRKWETFPRYGKNPRGGALLNQRKTHCRNGHPLTGDNVYIRPNGARRCRTCKRNQSKREKTKVKPGEM